MRYATVLVEVSDGKDALARAEFAAALAGSFGAGIIGVMACWPDVPAVEPNATIGMVAGLLEQERAATRCEIQLAERRFRAIAQERAAQVSFVGHLGTATDAIIGRSHVADIVVIGQNRDADIARGSADPQVLLERCGRPLLVLPAGPDAVALPETAVVIWHDGREARRAVRDALPLLQAARQVIVVQASEGDSLAEARMGTADVAGYLGRYGISARPVALRGNGRRSAEQLEDFARREGAGLVVAAGFARRRLLDQVLPDGAARMLTSCGIPCLVSA